MGTKIFQAVHEMAKGLYEADIMHGVTMREFDALCLKSPKPMTPMQIKDLRLKEKLSQPVFAMFLNVSPSTVKKWETGEKIPSGIALRLLSVVEHNGISIIQG